MKLWFIPIKLLLLNFKGNKNYSKNRNNNRKQKVNLFILSTSTSLCMRYPTSNVHTIVSTIPLWAP